MTEGFDFKRDFESVLAKADSDTFVLYSNGIFCEIERITSDYYDIKFGVTDYASSFSDCQEEIRQCFGYEAKENGLDHCASINLKPWDDKVVDDNAFAIGAFFLSLLSNNWSSWLRASFLTSYSYCYTNLNSKFLSAFEFLRSADLNCRLDNFFFGFSRKTSTGKRLVLPPSEVFEKLANVDKETSDKFLKTMIGEAIKGSSAAKNMSDLKLEKMSLKSIFTEFHGYGPYLLYNNELFYSKVHKFATFVDSDGDEIGAFVSTTKEAIEVVENLNCDLNAFEILSFFRINDFYSCIDYLSDSNVLIENLISRVRKFERLPSEPDDCFTADELERIARFRQHLMPYDIFLARLVFLGANDSMLQDFESFFEFFHSVSYREQFGAVASLFDTDFFVDYIRSGTVMSLIDFARLNGIEPNFK